MEVGGGQIYKFARAREKSIKKLYSLQIKSQEKNQKNIKYILQKEDTKIKPPKNAGLKKQMNEFRCLLALEIARGKHSPCHSRF